MAERFPILDELNDALALVKIRRMIFRENARLCARLGVPSIRPDEWPRLLRYLEERGVLGTEDGKIVHYEYRRGERRKAGEADVSEIIDVMRDYRKVNTRLYRVLNDLAADAGANCEAVIANVDRLTLTTEKPHLPPAIEELYGRWVGRRGGGT